AVKLVNVLRLGGIEIERATTVFAAGGNQYGAGSFVIRGAQPFEAYARDLLTPQIYPDMRLYPGGPPKRPYDITGWTLSYQMGVRVDRVAEAVGVPTERVDVAAPPRGGIPAIVAGQPYYYALDPRLNDAFTAVNRLLKYGARISRATRAIRVKDGEWPAGAFLVEPGVNMAALQAATSLGVTVAVVTTIAPSPPRSPNRPPRIGRYQASSGNTAEGWTR